MTQLTDLLTLMDEERSACNRLRKIYKEIEELETERNELAVKPNPTPATLDDIEAVDISLGNAYIRQDAAVRLLDDIRGRMRLYFSMLNGDVTCPA